MTIPEADRSQRCLTNGSPVTEDHRELLPSGQQKAYVVLTEEERSKGFVRPVRRTYTHVGVRPKHPVRDLTPEEHERYNQYGYIKYEEYPEDSGSGLGRFWTKAQLDSGCNSNTTMGISIAETYARDPGFYGGTFCCACRTHFPLKEFVWDGTNEVVGS